jgi:chaperonin GroES
MNLKPLGDRVIVKPAEAEEQTKSVCSSRTPPRRSRRRDRHRRGRRQAQRDGEKRIPIDVKVGDTVIYSKYGGTEVKIDGEEYKILAPSDIYAVVE